MNVDHMRLIASGHGFVEIDGMRCQYLVMRPCFESRMPNFAGRLGVNNYFTSSEVPKEFIPGFIAHEVHSFAMREEGHGGCCVSAIQFELRHLSRVPFWRNLQSRDAYLRLRVQYFSNLLDLYRDGRPPFWPDINFAEIEAGFDYLLRLG